MEEFALSLLLLGAISSGNSLPFWMTANNYGLMPDHNGALAWLSAGTQYDMSKTLQWKWGSSFALDYDRAGESVYNLMVDELYGSVRWKALSLDLGMKRFGLDCYGPSKSLGSMSSTGGHVIWSGNSRTMPGYSLNLEPTAIPFTNKHAWAYGSFADYRTLDNRSVKGALLHRTQLALVFNISRALDFSISLDHYGLWAGESNGKGRMPITIDNYFRTITGRSASSEGASRDQINVIGDQRGSETLRLTYHKDGWKFVAQHDIPYDDGSGMGLQNFPDGVNTLWFSFEDKQKWITDVLYEYHYTMWQSGTMHDRPTTDEEKMHLDPADKYHYEKHIIGGGDNYFNNGGYKSGWTYYGRTIGDPLLFPKGTYDGTWNRNDVTLGVENNRIKAHHFSVAGLLFRKAPYKIMLTFSKNYGTYRIPYKGESQWLKEWGTVKETPLLQLSGAFMGEIPLQRLSLLYGLYFDKGQLLSDLVGTTFGIRYDFKK